MNQSSPGARLLACILGIACAFASPPLSQAVRAAEREVEQISIDELTRRAAQSPDHAPLGPVRGAVGKTALTWQALGPHPIINEYWSGNADASGRTCSIVVDPRDANVAYAAAAQGGVWKTTDGGTTWTPMTDGLSSLSSGALALDPANADIIYYGTGEQNYSGDCFYGDGLFRSGDGGVTWSKIGTKPQVGSYISRVAVQTGHSNVILVASDRGVVRSADAGTTWTVTQAGGWCTDLAIQRTGSDTMYAAINASGIYKSVNAGASWTKLGGGLPTTGFARINFALSPNYPRVIYASFVSSSSSGLLGMYRSINSGASWTLLSSTPNYLGTQGWYDNVVIVDPIDPRTCYAAGVFPYSPGTKGMIRTTNAGASWTDITRGIDGSQLHPDMHALAFGPDRTLWTGNDGGVWKTRDRGAHWINCNHTLAVTQFYTVALHPMNPNFLLGGTQDNGALAFQGTDSWPEVSAGDGGPCAVEWDSPNIYYTTYIQLDPLYKYDNGSFVDDVTGPWIGDRASWANSPLVVDPNAPNTILAGTYRAWRTANSGVSWTSLSGDLSGGGYLLGMAVASGASNTIYSSSSSGRVYVTTDGVTWNPRYTGLPTSALPDVVVSPSTWQIAYVCADRTSGGRVYRTTDAGVTWTDVTGDLPSGLRGLALSVDFRTNPVTLYLGTDYGVYSSSDGGVHWTNSSLASVAVYDLGLDLVNNYLVAATHGRGMWRAPIGSAAAASIQVAHTPSAPSADVASGDHAGRGITALLPVSLAERRGMRLSYSLAHANDVTLVIYDLMGRLVRVMDHGYRVEGTHTVTWDGCDTRNARAPRGAYVAHLTAGSYETTRRVMLID
jgi:photosystem II stability/assembly factor-like uncharacterized protein